MFCSSIKLRFKQCAFDAYAYIVPTCFLDIIFSCVLHNALGMQYWFSTATLIREYFKRTRSHNGELDHNTDFDRNMYTRLLALGLIDSVITLPVTIAELVVSRLRSGNNTPFWPGLRTVHATITDVNTVTTERWKAQGIWMVIELKFSQWSCPFCALVFFALFG